MIEDDINEGNLEEIDDKPMVLTIGITDQKNNTKKREEPEIVGVEVDWDAVNQNNAHKVQVELSPEEEKKQAETRKRMFSYQEAESYFLEEADLTEQIDQI